LLGADSVHGNQRVLGTPLFPHNIGLAASHNVQNYINAARQIRNDMIESGANWLFGPTCSVSHHPAHGRYFESNGVDTSMIREYAKSFVKEVQDVRNGRVNGIQTSTKHFFGDGATVNGHDEGNNLVYGSKTFYDVNLAGYRGAIEANTGTIMCSFSAINNIPNAISHFALTKILRGELEFDGFVISDYDEVTKILAQKQPTSFITITNPTEAVAAMLNAGIDMFMLGFSIQKMDLFANAIKEGLQKKHITMDRVNEAVRRILAVKLASGLVALKNSNSTTNEIPASHNKAQTTPIKQKNATVYKEVLTAAKESLVLLKN